MKSFSPLFGVVCDYVEKIQNLRLGRTSRPYWKFDLSGFKRLLHTCQVKVKPDR